MPEKKIEGKTADQWVKTGLKTDPSDYYYFKKAIETNPNHKKAYYYLGLAYKTLAEKNPYQFRGIYYSSEDLYGLAVETFKKAITLEPRNANLYNLLGQCHEKLNNLQKAIETYARCLQVDPKNRDSAFNIGKVYSNMDGEENKLKAIESYQKYLKDHPDDYDALLNVGHVFRDLKKHAEALEYYKKSAEIKPDLDAAYFYMGFVHGKLKNDDEEIKCYKKALEINPNHVLCWHNMSVIYRDMRQKEVALYVWSIKNKVEDRELHFHDKQEVLDVFHEIENLLSLITREKTASTCMNRGKESKNPSESIELFEKACALYKENSNELGMIEALMSKGQIYQSEKNWQKCLETMLEAYKIYQEAGPKIQATETTTDTVYYHYLKIRRLSIFNSNDHYGFVKYRMAHATFTIGKCYHNLKKMDEATEYFEKSLKLYEHLQEPGHIHDCLAILSLTYMDKGNHVKALEYFEKARIYDERYQELDPKHFPDLQEIKRIMELVKAKLDKIKPS